MSISLELVELHPWLESATDVANDWNALSAINEDILDLLEPEDFEGSPCWLKASVPIQWAMPKPSRFESVEEWDARLSSLRAMPAEQVPPIILFMDSSGDFRVIDGFHRIALAIERGQEIIKALIRCDLSPKPCIKNFRGPGMGC